ncbi:EF-hand domain [Trinorchestia longiramus]|nr:EF-hand domain [Trinorchestia longiramus]
MKFNSSVNTNMKFNSSVNTNMKFNSSVNTNMKFNSSVNTNMKNAPVNKHEVSSTLEGHGVLNFDCFVKVVAPFLEDQDEEAMQNELKEAFRMYDTEGNGFIPVSALKEILAALDDKLTRSDLDNIVDEIDEDGSGTVDFDGRVSIALALPKIFIVFISF